MRRGNTDFYHTPQGREKDVGVGQQLKSETCTPKLMLTQNQNVRNVPFLEIRIFVDVISCKDEVLLHIEGDIQ